MKATFKFHFNRLGYYNKNNGQDLEQSARYYLTGEIVKADHVPFWVAGDCLNYQIKSAKATICTDCTLDEYLERSAAEMYLYCTLNGDAYEMSPAQFREFVIQFSYASTSSKDSQGVRHATIRLKGESQALLRWLTE